MARSFCSSWSRKSSGSFRGGKATRRVFGADPQTGAMPPPSICENTRCIAVPWSQRLTRYRKYSCVQTMLPSMLTKLGPGVRPICRYLPSRAIARNSKGSLRGGNSTARPPPISPRSTSAPPPPPLAVIRATCGPTVAWPPGLVATVRPADDGAVGDALAFALARPSFPLPHAAAVRPHAASAARPTVHSQEVCLSEPIPSSRSAAVIAANAPNPEPSNRLIHSTT